MSLKLKIPTSGQRANITANSYNETDNTVEVVFATEYEVRRRTWDGTEFIEVLECRDGSVRMERLNAGANLVDTHNTYSVNTILGVVERAWIENKVCKAIVRLSKREEVKGIVEDIKDGIISNISVGYRIFGATQVDNQDEVIKITVTDWEPTELTICSVPQDYTAGIRSLNEDSNFYEINVQTNNSMTREQITAEIRRLAGVAGIDDQTFIEGMITRALTLEAAQSEIFTKMADNQRALNNPPANTPPTPPANTPPADNSAAIAAERTRGLEIRRAVSVAGIDDETFVEGMITRGLTIDAARAEIFTRMAEAQPNIRNNNPSIRVTADETEKIRSAMSIAIEHRVNPSIELKDQAREYRSMSMIELGRECLTRAGVNTRGMSPLQIAEGALNITRAAGMHSTSDFPVILGNTINRSLTREYELQQRTFLPWTQRGSARDFREMTRATFGEFDDFKEVKEGGEYEYGTVGEKGEKYRVVKYGRIIAYTWEMMINDDLGAFQRIPRKIASAAARKQSDIIYSILTSNPAMSDNVALFHANHKNLISSGTAIGIDSIGEMRKLMRKQKGIDNKDFLNITPEFLITGPDNEQLALQYTSMNYTAATAGAVNVWAGSVKPIIEPRITGNAWYFSASPNAIDTIEYSFLEGQGELFTTQREGFEVDGVEIKARMVFGAKALEFRGLAKNPGQ